MSESIETLQGVSLRDLVPAAEFVGAADVRVRSISVDSRCCQPGDVFVAVRGGNLDGHDFVDQAIARGASAIIAQRPIACQVPLCVVPDSREVVGLLSQALCHYPGRSMRLIAVTGTNGKTTTSTLVASILKAAGHATGLLGTLGYHDGNETAPASLTTPHAPELAAWLSRMRAQGCTHAVIEVSSHAIAERRIAGLEFAHVGLTNLGRDHLDYHASLQEYHQTKAELFGYLATGGVAVLNADDAPSLEQAPLLPGGLLTIGMDRAADITAHLVERYKSEQTFMLCAGEMTIPVRTAIIGDHHIYNCLMAAAIGLAEGIDLPTIVRGIEAVDRVAGRLERIECGQSFGVFVDFAHTADALQVSLSTLREVTPGKIICVFGAGGNRDALKRPLMGRAVESLADCMIVTTDNPRFEDPETIAAEILAGCKRAHDARWMPNRVEAIHYALSLAGPDDCVLIAGRGPEAHQIVGHERLPLDDRDVARRWLYNLEPQSQYGALMSVSNT